MTLSPPRPTDRHPHCKHICTHVPGEADAARRASTAFLALCTTEPLTDDQANAVGTLAARAGHDDIVDVTVAEGVIRRHDTIVTSNLTHTRKIADATRTRLTIETI